MRDKIASCIAFDRASTHFDTLSKAFDFSARDSSTPLQAYLQCIHQELSDYERVRMEIRGSE